jgi:hypothetical protein
MQRATKANAEKILPQNIKPRYAEKDGVNLVLASGTKCLASHHSGGRSIS